MNGWEYNENWNKYLNSLLQNKKGIASFGPENSASLLGHDVGDWGSQPQQQQQKKNDDISSNVKQAKDLYDKVDSLINPKFSPYSSQGYADRMINGTDLFSGNGDLIPGDSWSSPHLQDQMDLSSWLAPESSAGLTDFGFGSAEGLGGLTDIGSSSSIWGPDFLSGGESIDLTSGLGDALSGAGGEAAAEGGGWSILGDMMPWIGAVMAARDYGLGDWAGEGGSVSSDAADALNSFGDMFNSHQDWTQVQFQPLDYYLFGNADNLSMWLEDAMGPQLYETVDPIGNAISGGDMEAPWKDWLSGFGTISDENNLWDVLQDIPEFGHDTEWLPGLGDIDWEDMLTLGLF